MNFETTIKMYYVMLTNKRRSRQTNESKSSVSAVPL